MTFNIPDSAVWGAILTGFGFWGVTALRIQSRFTKMRALIDEHTSKLNEHSELIRRVEKSATDTHALVSRLTGTLEALVIDVHDIKKYIMGGK